MIFIATLEGLSLVCVGVALAISQSGKHLLFHGGHDQNNNDNTTMISPTNPAMNITQQQQEQHDESIIMGILGAGLCWIIAAVLFIKKLCKKRRRRLQQEAEAAIRIAMDEVVNPNYQPIEPQQQQLHPDLIPYGAVDNLNKSNVIGEQLSGGNHDDHHDGNDKRDHNDEDDHDHQTIPSSHPSFWTVISLTTLGALDEMSYFPALVVGQVVSPLDLCLGTLLAACVIVVMVTCFLQPITPLMTWLDRIPLHGIVTMFATVLTLNVLWDWWHS
jgi:hypothetical protein